MDIGTWVALAALVASVAYHWADRRDMITRLQEWRLHVDKRIDSLEIDFKKSQYAVLETRVTHVEEFVDELRTYKHHVLDKYIPGLIEEHGRRLVRLEK